MTQTLRVEHAELIAQAYQLQTPVPRLPAVPLGDAQAVSTSTDNHFTVAFHEGETGGRITGNPTATRNEHEQKATAPHRQSGVNVSGSQTRWRTK